MHLFTIVCNEMGSTVHTKQFCSRLQHGGSPTEKHWHKGLWAELAMFFMEHYFLFEIMFFKLWLFRLRDLTAILKSEPIASKVSLSLQWKQTLFVANGKIWALRRKITVFRKPISVSMTGAQYLKTLVMRLVEILCNETCQHLEVLHNSVNK